MMKCASCYGTRAFLWQNRQEISIIHIAFSCRKNIVPFGSFWVYMTFSLYRLNFLPLLFLTEQYSLLMVKMHTAIESPPFGKWTTLWCTFLKYLSHLQQLNFDRFWKIVKKYCYFCRQEVFHECKSCTDNRAWIPTAQGIFTTSYIIHYTS